MLADVKAASAETIWNLGDMLGYTPMPNEVIERLQQHRVVSIIGNYDTKVLAFAAQQAKWQRKKSGEKVAAFAWNDAHLSTAARSFLEALPERLERTVEGHHFLLVHGSPTSVEEHLTGATPESRLRELAQLTSVDVILCGHSHDPFARQVDGRWFVNPGSVGRPEGGDWRACYALITVTPQTIEVEHRRLEYDLERAVQAITAAGLPERFADVLRYGRNLDDLDPAAASRPDLEAAASAWARQIDPEPGHAEQVTRLALQLFDQLESLAPDLTAEDRSLLACAAWLHDIGWSRGRKRHHKVALDLIMQDTHLPLHEPQRRMVGLVARYHRRALPQLHHKVYRKLSEPEQWKVQQLASVLRIADGLDRGHVGAVQQVRCSLSDEQVEIQCLGSGDISSERHAAQEKADLFKATFHRKVVVRK